MNRKEAIEKIKKAYENKELGYQRGAKVCSYYDSKTDSCCAVGVLVKDESLFNGVGNQLVPFIESHGSPIEEAMNQAGKSELYGLTIDELCALQYKHDSLIEHRDYNGDYDDTDFVEYLYGLEH